MFSKRISSDVKAIHSSLRWDVFGVVAEHGGKKELEELLETWIKPTNNDEQYEALQCLVLASNSELVR